MAFINKEMVDEMNAKMLERLKENNMKIRKETKNICINRVSKPKYIEVLSDVLMCSPYLDVLYGDRENYEMAAEHLASEDVVKVVRCQNCAYYRPHSKPVEDFDGKCIVRECETDENEFCSYGTPKERGGEK